MATVIRQHVLKACSVPGGGRGVPSDRVRAVYVSCHAVLCSQSWKLVVSCRGTISPCVVDVKLTVVGTSGQATEEHCVSAGAVVSQRTGGVRWTCAAMVR